MRRNFFLFLSSVVALIFGMATSPLPAAAMSLTPAKTLITIDPGASLLVPLTIENTETEPLTVNLKAVDARQDTAGRALFGGNLDGTAAWARPEAEYVTLLPKERRRVIFNISVPTDAAPGSRYLGLVVAPAAAATGQVTLSAQLVSLLTIQVAGLVNEQVNILRFAASPWRFNLNPLPLVIELKNTGAIETPLTGKIIISSWGGKQIFSAPVPLGNMLVAGSTRVLNLTMPLTGLGRWPGVYRATLAVTYGLTQQTAEHSSMLYYLPWWSLVVGSMVAVMIVGIFFLHYRKKLPLV